MTKQLTINDFNDYIDDNQQVEITAYNVPLYEGDALHIPAGYCKYPLAKKMYTKDDVLKIDLDCQTINRYT